jgi:hypothetical protein
MVESGKSKGQRYFAFAFIAMIVALALVPASAAIGSSLAAPFDGSNVLATQSEISAVWSNATHEVPFTRNSTTYAAEFSMPAGATTAYLVTNITVEQMQASTVSALIVSTNYAGNSTVTFGLGTQASNFVPYEELSVADAYQVSLPISPAYLTGNGSQQAMVEIQSGATSLTVSIAAHGNTGLSSWFGPAVAEDIAYIFGGFVILILAIVAMPWADIDIRRFKRLIPQRKTRRIRSRGGR